METVRPDPASQAAPAASADEFVLDAKTQQRFDEMMRRLMRARNRLMLVRFLNLRRAIGESCSLMHVTRM